MGSTPRLPSQLAFPFLVVGARICSHGLAAGPTGWRLGPGPHAGSGGCSGGASGACCSSWRCQIRSLVTKPDKAMHNSGSSRDIGSDDFWR